MSLRLVVDTSIIFAAVLRDSTTRRILLSAPIIFLAPEHCFDEMAKHIDEISDRNGMTKAANQEILKILHRNIRTLRWNELSDVWDEAVRLMAAIDADDAPFLAAALSMDCDGIWTEDPHFQRQSAIKVWRTKDLMHFIGY